MYGKSVAESTDPSRIQRRLPTIVSPLHMGVKFKLQTIETPQSTCTQVTCTQHTILVVHNITLVMPESTFSNLSLSDWFEISTQSLTRVCFANTCAAAARIAQGACGSSPDPHLIGTTMISPGRAQGAFAQVVRGL